MIRFRPRLAQCAASYDPAQFRADLLAGVTVGVVALPLAIGFGIASGASPATGVYTAIIGGLLVSALGGSRVQIGGPAGAFVGLVYATIVRYGLPDLLVCTMMAGGLLFLLGALRLGSLIKFIPHPVTTGFTCGIAITIISTQVKDFLGLPIPALPASFAGKLLAFGRHLPQTSAADALLGLACAAAIKLWPKRWGRRVPGSIVVVVFGTLAARMLRLPVATIGARFGPGAIPRALPALHWPAFSWAHLGDLAHPAVAIALLAAIESLLSAVVSDGMIDDRHDSNQELMAQGVANVVSPLFGGIPVTGVIARTATNVRSGATSPVAGIVHALTLLAIVLAAAPLAQYVPLTVLGAVLIVVSINMGEWDEFLILHRQPKGDAAVFLVTFVLTVFFDLTLAVEVGMLLAAFLFIKRISDATEVGELDKIVDASGAFGHEPAGDVPAGALVYRVFGALLFGAADKLDAVIRRMGSDSRVVVLHLSAVVAMDRTALGILDTLHEKLERHGRHLVLSGSHAQPHALMAKAGFLDRVGPENVCPDLPRALERARVLLRR
ncbi:MAG TPA: SulP family inorganic anion transporter [Opitutaceae bacterium]|nr:SulP family inorganic anion transporter [Opitutaceae bacterium]